MGVLSDCIWVSNDARLDNSYNEDSRYVVVGCKVYALDSLWDTGKLHKFYLLLLHVILLVVKHLAC